MAVGRIFIGVGGWTFEPWRGTYYPEKLTQKRELEHMGSTMTGVEVNGTFYGSQKPESFRKWHDEVPEKFHVHIEGHPLRDQQEGAGRGRRIGQPFHVVGHRELKDKLGPINWQLAPPRSSIPPISAHF